MAKHEKSGCKGGEQTAVKSEAWNYNEHKEHDLKAPTRYQSLLPQEHFDVHDV